MATTHTDHARRSFKSTSTLASASNPRRSPSRPRSRPARGGAVALALAGMAGLAACAGDEGLDAAGTRATDDVTASEHAVAGGRNDTGGLYADVAVRLAGTADASGSAFLCSGAFITPTTVLTAHHCIFGDDAHPDHKLLFPITVQIGSDLTSLRKTYKVSTPAQALVMTARDPQTVSAYGTDVAVVFLDVGQYADDAGYIVRPSLSSACTTPGGCSSFAVAGWSPVDTSRYRQLAYLNPAEVTHGTGHPDSPPGQYWQHTQGSIHVDPGDSGGPLFIEKTDGAGNLYRDVIGVVSGYSHNIVGSDTDNFTDITTGGPRDWLAQTMVEAHTAAWMSRHGKTTMWRGEADYTGPANLVRDQDGDHWYDEHDNCPGIANHDQLDSNDDGRGDACPLPVPSVGPVGCYCHESCGGVADIICPWVGEKLVLMRLTSSGWIAVQRLTAVSQNAYPTLSNYGAGAVSDTYEVCSYNDAGNGPCSAPVGATYDYGTCGSSGATGSGSGGGAILPICTTCGPGGKTPPPRHNLQ